jgi:hypothetical protein
VQVTAVNIAADSTGVGVPSSPRIGDELMSSKATILLYGADAGLLYTRRLVLASSGFEVVSETDPQTA